VKGGGPRGKGRGLAVTELSYLSLFPIALRNERRGEREEKLRGGNRGADSYLVSALHRALTWGRKGRQKEVPRLKGKKGEKQTAPPSTLLVITKEKRKGKVCYREKKEKGKKQTEEEMSHSISSGIYPPNH